jgi:CHASE3 domain sensor protein
MIELEKQSRRRKIIRGLITFLLLFALVGGGFYLGYRYLEDSQQRQVELEKKKVNSEKQKVKTEYRKMVLENSEVLVAKETLDQTNQNENSGHDFAVADANYRQIFKNKTDIFADKIKQDNLLNENTREIVNGYVNQANKKLTQATKYLRETKEDLDSSASETSSTAETDNNLDLSQRDRKSVV